MKKTATKKAPKLAQPKGVKASKASASTAKKAKASAKPAAVAEPVENRLRKSPLNRKELGEFRRLLLEKRRQLLGDMSGMEAEAFRAKGQDGSGDLSTMPVHMADIGTDNYEQEFTLGLLESERRLLRDIDEALDRIEQNTYGICVGTGKAISLPRLRAKPWAKYCIEYARMIEQGLVRRPASTYQAPSDDEGEPGDEEVDEIEEEEEETEVAGEVEGPVDEEEDIE